MSGEHINLLTDGVVSRPAGQGLVLYHIDAERFVELNVSGRVLWESAAAANGSAPVRDLVEQLRAKFEVEQVQAERDVEQFVAELRNAGLADSG